MNVSYSPLFIFTIPPGATKNDPFPAYRDSLLPTQISTPTEKSMGQSDWAQPSVWE